MVEKISGTFETLPLVTDGLIGLGNCPGTLLDQLSTIKAVSQNVLGVCLAKDVPWPRTTLPAAEVVPVGYISLGTGFDQKFDQSNSAWVKMIRLSPWCVRFFSSIHVKYNFKWIAFGILVVTAEQSLKSGNTVLTTPKFGSTVSAAAATCLNWAGFSGTIIHILLVLHLQ